jgi:hypothetical protein
MSRRVIASGLVAAALLAAAGCASPAPAAVVRHVAAIATTPDQATAIAHQPARLSLEDGMRLLTALDPARVREGGNAHVALGVGSAPGGILGAVGYPGFYLGRGFAVRYFRFWRSGPYWLPYQRFSDAWRPYAYGGVRPYLVEDGGGYYPYTWTAP